MIDCCKPIDWEAPVYIFILGIFIRMQFLKNALKVQFNSVFNEMLFI